MSALPRCSRLIVTGSLLALVGVGLIGLAWQMPGETETVALYDYVSAGEARLPAAVTGRLPAQTRLARYELRLPNRTEPLAEFVAADYQGRRIVLSFHSRLVQPIEFPDVDPEALGEVARAIREHSQADTLLLGWWDTSQRLALLSGRAARFERTLLEPLLLPAPWQPQAAALRARAQRFYGESVGLTDPDFSRFVEALLSPPEQGVAMLAQLAAGQKAVLVVDLRDAYKLAALDPVRFPWGFRDFPGAERSHGLMRRIKEWLREQGHAAYAVEPRPERVTRVHYLGKAATATLASRILPFYTASPLAAPGLRLVFQHATYWVYEFDRPAPAKDNERS